MATWWRTECDSFSVVADGWMDVDSWSVDSASSAVGTCRTDSAVNSSVTTAGASSIRDFFAPSGSCDNTVVVGVRSVPRLPISCDRLFKTTIFFLMEGADVF